MNFSEDLLRFDERAVFALRALYRQFGYSQYRMNRFEEYELYAENKAFLASGDIITFTARNGKLMAMRPDVTLSIVKNTKDSATLQKLYYSENVYRPMGPGLEFKERMQTGLECLGTLDTRSIGEVVMLARRSLDVLGAGAPAQSQIECGEKRACLDISHTGYIQGLLQNTGLTGTQKTEVLRRICDKNVHELGALCAEFGIDSELRDKITALTALYGPIGETLTQLRELSVNEETDTALRELTELRDVLKTLGADAGVNLDFSVRGDMRYYCGVVFQGYIEGIPAKVLSGGRYDKLLQKFGKKSGAIGFAVYLDLLERLDDKEGRAQ